MPTTQLEMHRAQSGVDDAFDKTWEGVDEVPVEQRTAFHLARLFLYASNGSCTFDPSLVNEVKSWTN